MIPAPLETANGKIIWRLHSNIGPTETLIEAPAIDLNYGLGDHVQLTLQTAAGTFETQRSGSSEPRQMRPLRRVHQFAEQTSQR